MLNPLRMLIKTSGAVTVVLASMCLCAANAEATRDQMMVLREHINKGNYLMARGQFQQAIDEYEQCFDIDPGNQVAKENIVLAHNNWGIASFRQKKYDDAEAQWRLALKINPLDRNAKNNLVVLKNTLSRLGRAADAEPKKPKPAEQEAGNKPVEDTPSGAVMIKSGTAAPSNDAGTAAVIIKSGTDPSGVSGAVILKPSPTPASVDTQESAPEYSSPGTAIRIISKPAPANPGASVSSQAPAPAPVSAPAATTGQTIEERLAAIEMKVYGRRQEDLPVFKRIEKLETDTAGSVKQGTIQERLETLRKAYGL